MLNKIADYFNGCLVAYAVIGIFLGVGSVGFYLFKRLILGL